MAHVRKLRFPILTTILVAMSLTLVIATVAAQTEGKIAGIVYIDTNENGIREEGEEGYQNVEVTFDSGGWSTTINTSESGAFDIMVNPATWTVSIDPPAGYTADVTSTEVVIENPGEEITDVEFALVVQTEDDTADDTEDGEDGDEVLPASGSVVSGGVVIGALIGLMVVGLAMVLVGQRRNPAS